MAGQAGSLACQPKRFEMHLNRIDASDSKKEISVFARLVKDCDFVAGVNQGTPYTCAHLYDTNRRLHIKSLISLKKRLTDLLHFDTLRNVDINALLVKLHHVKLDTPF